MRRLCAVTVYAMLVAFVACSTAWAQTTATYKAVQLRPIASVKGSDLYKEYCAHCHGDDGKGHGPDAAGLPGTMPDLTTIAARNGGKFPRSAVEDAITRWKQVPRTMTDAVERKRDMEQGIVREQTPVMPAFGPLFAKLYPQEVQDRTVRLANLVAYVKSLQVAAAP